MPSLRLIRTRSSRRIGRSRKDESASPWTRRNGDDVAVRAAATGASYVDVIANPNALGFYERAGFRACGDVSTRFGRGIRMSFELLR